MDDAGRPYGEPGRESRLVDVSATLLSELFASEESVLAVALRQLVADLDQSAQTISGWSSYLDGSSDDHEDTPSDLAEPMGIGADER